MEYIALSGVIVTGEVFTKGEVIHGLTDEQAERLLKKGVIREAGASLSPAPETDTEAEEAPAETEETENEADGEDEGEEVEAPEIDAMDGVVTEPKEEKKPARRKAKGGA